MAEDLKAHAETQAALFATRLTDARTALTAAQDELQRRDPDPDNVPPEQRREKFGASQYLDVATLDEVALRKAEADIRAELAAIPTPTSSDPLVIELKDNLLAQANARVILRDAGERASRARAAVSRAAAAVERETALSSAADSYVTVATDHQTRITDLKTRLAAPPLDTLVADANTLLGSSAYTDAKTRIEALMPPKLLERSGQRYAESLEPASNATLLAGSATTTYDTSEEASGHAGVTLANANRELDDAEKALRDYVNGAVDRLARVNTLLLPLPGLPDLSTAEAGSIDENSADLADAVAALPKELALATARKTWDEKNRAVVDATLAALAEDPDRDPNTVQAVKDAIDERDDAAVLGALTDARNDYDAASQTALDSWEVEVPPWLWSATQDYHEATAELTYLSDNAVRTALVTELDTAIDAVAAAADKYAVHQRTSTTLSSRLDELRAEVEAISLTASERRSQFVAGNGRGGRHVLEA